jgi:ferrous iron transport protein B
VGKSVLFNALTSRYVTVSNYPGTTVDVSRGQMQVGETAIAVLDTPGMYSLMPITEEERVGRDLLLRTPPDLVIHVVDAKHLGRMLNFTLQLLEAGLPVLLVVNLIDEAYQLGIEINADRLQKQLGIPVVLTAAARNIGVQELKCKVADYVESSRVSSRDRNRDRPDRISVRKR